MPFAPKVKLYGNAAYRFPVTDALNLALQSDLSFRSKTQYSLMAPVGNDARDECRF